MIVLGDKVLSWIAWIILNLYIWFLPQWSYYLNQNLGLWKVCSTPAEKILCADPASNYTEIAVNLGRYDEHGYLIGCGWGQGALPDSEPWGCRATAPDGSTTDSYSVSYYSETSFGIGALSATTAAPFIYLHKLNWDLRQRSRAIRWVQVASMVSLTCFQVFFLIFQCLPLHIFPQAHGWATIVFSAACLIHSILNVIRLAKLSYDGTFDLDKTIRTYVILTSVATLVLLCGYSIPQPRSQPWMHYWFFFYSECLWLSFTFLQAPVMFVSMKDGEQREMAAQQLQMPQHLLSGENSDRAFRAYETGA